MQVPAYQVNSGRDQASATTAGAKSALLESVKEQAGQKIPGPGSTTNPGDPAAKGNAGATASQQAATPAKPGPSSTPGGSPNPLSGTRAGTFRGFQSEQP